MPTVLARVRRASTTSPNQQRFDPNNSNSLFVNQNFLAAGFPLPILPSGLPADLHFTTPYVQQISFGIEQDLGHNMSLNIAYNSTGGRHLNRPINVNPVNPQLLIANWRNAVNAVKAGTAAPGHGEPDVEPADGCDCERSESLRRWAHGTLCGSAAAELFPAVRSECFAGAVSRQPGGGAGQCVALASEIAVCGWAWQGASGALRRYVAESHLGNLELQRAERQSEETLHVEV